MFCKHCGAKVAEDAEFCSACGKQLKSANYHKSKNVPVVRYRTLHRTRRILILAGIIAAALLLLAGGVGIAKNHKKKTETAPSAEIHPQATSGNASVGAARNNTKTAGEEKEDRKKQAESNLSQEDKDTLGVFQEKYLEIATGGNVGAKFLHYAVGDMDQDGYPDMCVIYSYGSGQYGLEFFTSDQNGNITDANTVPGLSPEGLTRAGGRQVDSISVENMVFYGSGYLDLTGTGEYFVSLSKDDLVVEGDEAFTMEKKIQGLPYSSTPGEYRVIQLDKDGSVQELAGDAGLYNTLKQIFTNGGSLDIAWKDF